MRDFYSDYAVYEGVTYRVKNYFDRVDLFAIEDIERKDVILSVPEDKLDDKYTLINNAILNGVKYVYFDIEDSKVTYGTTYKDSAVLQRDISDFDLIYQWIIRGKDKPVQKRVIYSKNSEALIKEFYPEEAPNGRIMFSVNSENFSGQDLLDAIRTLYPGKVREESKEGTFDEVIRRISIDGIEFQIFEDLCWDITDILPEQKGRGEDFIFEIVEFFNEKH